MIFWGMYSFSLLLLTMSEPCTATWTLCTSSWPTLQTEILGHLVQEQNLDVSGNSVHPVGTMEPWNDVSQGAGWGVE